MFLLLKNTYNKNSSLITKVSWRFVQLLTKQGIPYVFFFLTAAQLSKYEFGIYNYILNYVFILMTFTDFGTSQSTSKFVAEYAKTDPGKLSRVLFSISTLILTLSVLSFLVIYVVRDVLFNNSYLYFLIVSPTLLLIPLVHIFDGIYRGLDRFKDLAIKSLLSGIISVLVAIPLIYSFGIWGALGAQTIFYFLMCLGMFWGYHSVAYKVDIAVIKEIGKYALVIGIGGIGLLLSSRIDVLFLGRYGYINEIAYYEIANRILWLLLIPYYVIAQTISPMTTQYYTEGNFVEVRNKFIKYFKFSFVLAVVLIFFVYVFSQFFLRLLPQYNTPEMKHIILILLPAFFTQIVNGIFPTGFVLSTGHAKISTIALLVFGSLNVILNYIFINQYGYIGIFYSTVLVKCSTDICFLAYYYFGVLKKLE